MNLHGTFLTLSFMLRTMCNLTISIAIFDHFTCHTYFQWCTTVGTLLCEAIGTTATGHDRRRRCQDKRSICSRMMVDNYQLDRHQVFTLVLMYGGLSVVRVRPRTLLSTSGAWVCPLFRVCPLCVESWYLPTVGIKKIGHDRFCFRNRFFQTLKSIFYKSSYVLLNYRCDVV